MKKHILQENYERFFGKREFGDPLLTFEDVMEKHQKNKFKEDLDSVGKEDDDVDNDGDSDASDDYLKNRRDVISKAIEKESVTEGWWDSMSDKAKAAYIKTHGEAPNVAGDDDDDYDMGPDMDSRDYDMDDDDDKYDKYGQEMGGTPSKPSGEPEDEPSGELPDKVDSSQDASELQDKLDSIEDNYSEIGSKWDEKLGELSSIDVDEITDEQIEEMGEAGREMSRNYKASSISREMMSIDVSDEEGLEEFNDLLSNLNKQSSSPRTGNELNQETLTIDGKQFRRISEGVEKQPKPKYEFSEFYQRFKRQE